MFAGSVFFTAAFFSPESSFVSFTTLSPSARALLYPERVFEAASGRSAICARRCARARAESYPGGSEGSGAAARATTARAVRGARGGVGRARNDAPAAGGRPRMRSGRRRGCRSRAAPNAREGASAGGALGPPSASAASGSASRAIRGRARDHGPKTTAGLATTARAPMPIDSARPIP